MKYVSAGQLPLLGLIPPRGNRYARQGIDEGLPDQLRVILHMDSAPGTHHPDRKVVEATCSARWIETWRFAREGAPPNAATVTLERSGRTHARHWLYITSIVLERGGRRFLARTVNGVHNSTSYWSNGVSTGHELDPGDDEDPPLQGHELRSALAAAGHVVISADPAVLCGAFASWSQDCVVLDWPTGAALLGRLARERGEQIPIGDHQVVGESWYYADAFLDLLPEYETYADRMHALGAESEPLFALRARVLQVLFARDELTWRLGQFDEPASFRVTDALDRVLVFSLAAFDELAHSVHDAFHLDVPMVARKWNDQRFVKALQESPQTLELGTLWSRGSQPRASNAVLRFLRNTIHGTGFGASRASEARPRSEEYPLSAPVRGLPREVEEALQVGSFGGWGLTIDESRLHVDPECLCEKVVYEMFVLLNQTLAAASDCLGSDVEAAAPTSYDLSIDMVPPSWGNFAGGGYRAAFGLGRLPFDAVGIA